MNTSLIPISDLERMAQAFAKSQMFGAKTPDQAMALLLLAQAEGVHPAIAMRDFDVIQGKPAKKAEAMQRSFLAAGGKIEWHKYDDTGAEATFSHPQGGTLRLGWDAERAKKAGLTSKDMYGKYARQMYGARVISEGVRKVYPAATSGLYVPEEVKSFGKQGEPRDMGPAEVVQEAQPADERPRQVQLDELCAKAGTPLVKILDIAKCKTVEEMSDDDFTEAKAALHKKIAQKEARA